MLIHRCDACGKLIETWEQFADMELVRHRVSTQSSTILDNIDCESKDVVVSMDLCKGCTDSVLEFLRGEVEP